MTGVIYLLYDGNRLWELALKSSGDCLVVGFKALGEMPTFVYKLWSDNVDVLQIEWQLGCLYTRDHDTIEEFLDELVETLNDCAIVAEIKVE